MFKSVTDGWVLYLIGFVKGDNCCFVLYYYDVNTTNTTNTNNTTVKTIKARMIAEVAGAYSLPQSTVEKIIFKLVNSFKTRIGEDEALQSAVIGALEGAVLVKTGVRPEIVLWSYARKKIDRSVRKDRSKTEVGSDDPTSTQVFTGREVCGKRFPQPDEGIERWDFRRKLGHFWYRSAESNPQLSWGLLGLWLREMEGKTSKAIKEETGYTRSESQLEREITKVLEYLKINLPSEFKPE